MGVSSISNITQDEAMHIYMNAVDGADVAMYSYDGATLTIPTETSTSVSAACLSFLWQKARSRRVELLIATDWTLVLDSPLTAAQKTAWATYRQALRDITTQPDPANITWPTPPA